jgi:hypothetical protein
MTDLRSIHTRKTLVTFVSKNGIKCTGLSWVQFCKIAHKDVLEHFWNEGSLSMASMSKSSVLAVLALVLAIIVLSGCGTIALPSTAAPAPDTMPDFVHKASAIAQEAYRFAKANPHEMEKYPCYCGCVKFGHTSLRDCFIKSIDAAGKVTFDDHAAGCGICVLIAQDVIRLRTEGKSSPEIRTYIDQTYQGFGSSTHTPLPAA